MNALWLTLRILFHPWESFNYIKYDRNRINYLPLILLPVLILAVRVSYIFTVHYPLASLKPRDANIGLEIVKMLLPLVTWAIACYAVTSILDGEVYLYETLMASVYAMLPYIVFTIPLALLSHLMNSSHEKILFFLQAVIWIWVLLLIFISLMSMNSYSFGKAVGIFILSGLAMLLVWAVGVLIFALISQLWMFIKGLMIEIRMLYYG